MPSGENGEVYALHLMPPALGDEAADADDAGNYTDTGERVRLIDAMRSGGLGAARAGGNFTASWAF